MVNPPAECWRIFESTRTPSYYAASCMSTTLDLPCRKVLGSGQRPTEVVGPLLEDEAAALHDGVWTK